MSTDSHSAMAAEIVRLQQVAAALTDVVSAQDKMLVCYRTENFRHLGTYADRQLAAQVRLRAALAGGDGAPICGSRSGTLICGKPKDHAGFCGGSGVGWDRPEDGNA